MISFGATPIYSIKLKQDDKFVPAKISELHTRDKEDKKAIREVKKDLKKQETKYGFNVARNFLDSNQMPHRYYVIELDNNDEFKNRITCLMEVINKCTTNGECYTNVCQLGTYDKVAKEQNIQGSGRAMIYGAIKMAKEDENESIIVDSRNDEFYRHLGFKAEDDEDSPFSQTYSLSSEEYDKFIKETEEKYQY